MKVRNNRVSSFLWSFIEKASVQCVSFIVGLLLARLLMPEDYGILAIIMVFTQIANVFIDCGIMKALIQNQQCSDTDYSTSLFTNVGIGIVCYGILFFLSPLLALFFKQPVLCEAMRVYGLVLIITSFSVVQRARFQKQLQFRTIAFISIVALFVGGGTGLWMAFDGFGVWSLVCYYLLMESVKTLLFWIRGNWWPMMVFSRESFSRIFSFGSKILLANLIHTVIHNLYTFVIGRVFSAESLGLFSRGQNFASVIPTNVSHVMEQAGYPIFCSMQNNRQQLSISFCRCMQLAFCLSAPVGVMLSVLAHPLVLVLLTEKWLGAVFFLQVLALGYMFDPVMRLNAIIINTTGKSEYSLYSELIKKGALILIIAVTCPFGINAMAFGLVANSFADIMAVTIFTRKVIGVRFVDEMKLLCPNLLCCVIMAIGIILIMTFLKNPYLQIICGGLAGAVIYMFSLRVVCRSQYDYVSARVKNIIRRH